MRTQNELLLAHDRLWSNIGCRLAGVTPLLTVLALALSGCAAGSQAMAGSAAEMIPLFPSGFTIVPAIGTWRADASGSTPELSF